MCFLLSQGGGGNMGGGDMGGKGCFQNNIFLKLSLILCRLLWQGWLHFDIIQWFCYKSLWRVLWLILWKIMSPKTNDCVGVLAWKSVLLLLMYVEPFQRSIILHHTVHVMLLFLRGQEELMCQAWWMQAKQNHWLFN